ncbi:MAG: ADP-glyceromanno-heptose 6-epimerase [Gammaproteobacteria bacterium]|nr:ADP-glyceromanno-heptose 6-epimerase [Gammaproteobacteria bacterium]
MIVVTGGAGFIGSNLVKGLNAAGHAEVIVVDDLTDGRKFRNLRDCLIADYIDKDDFRDRLCSDTGPLPGITHIFHQGACTDTMERDGRFMLDNNYEYSRILLDHCLEHRICFLYASSAAVYGNGRTFVENSEFECPVNVYGYSKKIFDDYVRRRTQDADTQVVGLRYFNVYGPGEGHKGRMASVAFHLNEQLRDGESVRLFAGSGGFADGEQRRDFIHVQDVVRVNLWFMDHPERSGIFNVGTGRSRSFKELARLVMDWHGRGRLQFVDFPGDLIAGYQHFTEADLGKLRAAGFTAEFLDLEQGIRSYLECLNAVNPGGPD